MILGLKKYFAVRVANLTATKGLGLRGWEDGFMDADGNPFPLNDLMNDDVSANPWDNIWEWGASQRAYRFANAGYKVYTIALCFSHCVLGHGSGSSLCILPTRCVV